MNKWIAERKLLCAPKGSSTKSELLVRIGAPYIVEPSTVSFPVTPETSGCTVEVSGKGVQVTETAYGADLIQALQLASNVDPILRSVSKTYDLFFIDGEPYFE
jgi:hypothetical protein